MEQIKETEVWITPIDDWLVPTERGYRVNRALLAQHIAREENKDLIKVEFRNFPFDVAGLNAAKLAHCKKDGKSDILHILFKNQKKWLKGNTVEDVNNYLGEFLKDQKIDLDFNKCINDKSIEDHLLEDRIEAMKKFDINATPTLIINGKKFDKSLNYKNIKKALEKLI